MKVRLSTPAKAEVHSAIAYARRDSVKAAKRLQLMLEQALDSLKTFPNRGRIGPIPGTRELVIRGAPYIIAYEIEGDRVTVLRIRHTSQDPSPD